MKKKKLPLRPNVCMLVVNRRGKLFLGERAGKRNHWQFPQGGVEKGTTIRENVYKELAEELGVDRSLIGKLIRLKARHSYEWDKVPSYAKGKWRGQAQTFFVVEFLGKSTDIDLEADEDQELQSFKWCSVSQVRRLAEPKRLLGYEGPLKEFQELLDNGAV
jgi:putative (di)nucleoside polyphosphate hydrolase